jgi:hypothetical protein
MNPKTLSRIMAELGRRGGRKTSKKKQDATKRNLEKARKVKADKQR